MPQHVHNLEVSQGASNQSLNNYGFIGDAIFFTCSHAYEVLSNKMYYYYSQVMELCGQGEALLTQCLNRCLVSDSSANTAGMAFLIFIGIITYHVNLRMKWKLQHIPRYFTKRNHGCENSIIVENSNAQNHQERQPRGPTMTVVDLRSPLDVINADYVLM